MAEKASRDLELLKRVDAFSLREEKRERE